MIYKIAAYTGKEIILQKILPIKRTARSPVQYICKMEGVVVLVVIARSDIQKFYLKRSIEKQEEFADEYDEYFSLNMPIHKGEIDDFYFAVYYYFENSKWTKDKRPLEKLSLLYKQYAKRYSVTEELIQKIEYDFLSAWPVDFHGQIRDLEIYKKYFLLLRKQKDLVIYKEHGDYTTNNILNVGNKQYLMDFEFAKSFQPIWLDYYDYCRTTHRRYDKTWIEDLKIKSLLMDEMNNILDDGLSLPSTQYIYEITNECIDNHIKLIDNINCVIDDSCLPKVKKIIENKNNIIKMVIPNFTYNRFDVMYGDNFEIYEVTQNNKKIYIPIHVGERYANIGVWLVDISAQAFMMLVEKIFVDYPKINKIQTRYSLNYYNGLHISNHWKVELPNNIDVFYRNLSDDTKRNIKRYPKRLMRDFGNYCIRKYSGRDNISSELVEKYFYFKRKTHNVEYDLTSRKYLADYFVTTAYSLTIDNEISSIFFSCEIDEADIVWSENIAYNSELYKYSVGTILYYYFINDSINNKKKYLFLGDGKQDYKRRFNGINQLVFDGYIIRNSFFIKIIECLKRKIKKMMHCFYSE